MSGDLHVRDNMAMGRQYSVLEYDKILRLLAEHASSALGAAEAEDLLPAVHPDEIRRRLAETAEAVSFIMRKGTPGIDEFGNISGTVDYAEKGGSLSMAQLLAVTVQMAAVRGAMSFLKESAGDDGAGGGVATPILFEIASAMTLHKDTEDRIRSSILSENEMADGASPELRHIRRQIGVQNENIRTQLNRLITSASYRDILQDHVITRRDGRWVVPVKSESAKQLPGIIHDRSKGGATVFIEPQAVVNANNALRELDIEEKREIDRVLVELSSLISDISDELRMNQDMLTRLDFIFAKGLLACEMKANEPVICEDLILEVVNARHPLIYQGSVVPVSLTLGKDYSALIITGPNTGGKTVTLKTVGLFVFMAGAGLHLPASRAVIPAVKDVFADIGDEQSIEQSLSTFSSHMKNIVEIVRKAGKGSIVFLDELGAGTDPTEGAALAISILETLVRRGCLVMATTHYTELKKYALAADGVENASMEFDVKTLSPTFRLRVGLPGRSNAFEIARKLGLPESVVARAAESMDSGSIAFETVIEQADADRRAAEKARVDAEHSLAEIEKKSDALNLEVARFETDKAALMEKARAESLAKIAEAGEYADIIKMELKALLDEAGDLIEITRSGASAVANAKEVPSRGDLYRRLDEHRKAISKLDGEFRNIGAKGSGKSDGKAPCVTSSVYGDKSRISAGDLRIGDTVRLVSLDTEGEVVTLPDEKGELQILVGRIRVTVPLADLRAVRYVKGDHSGRHGPARRAQQGGSRAKRYNGAGSGGAAHIHLTKANSVSSSIDVHGYTLDDAIMEVDKYIDDA
ncbi:MAG: hypothetical protein LBO70_03260, partial [Clostridiales Family XIII bacterium]|nr:hypothetical protein [Clostridiales Family XIII bacterium]